MSSNPYAPPLAKVEDTFDHQDAGPPQFFQVAPWKLVLMIFATLGFYQIFWLYQHWRLVKTRDRSDIWPVPRAIFSVFFCYSLFKRVRDDGVARQLSGPPAAGALATAWILCSIAWRLPGSVAFLGMISWVVVVPIQAYANRINAQAAPNAPRNDRLTWLNWIAVGLAAIFWILVVVGLTLPASA
jgi:hypothetical protein